MISIGIPYNSIPIHFRYYIDSKIDLKLHYDSCQFGLNIRNKSYANNQVHVDL